MIGMQTGVGPIAALVPSAVAVAGGGATPVTDPLTLLMQLGIGGVLVAFAVWLQDKFAKANKAQVDAERLLTQQRTEELIGELRRRADEAERKS